VNPYDLDRIGAADGQEVLLRSRRRDVTLRCTADEAVTKGTVCVGLNLDAPGVADRVVGVLVDPGTAVTEVRMESL
jgi:predicted molibdopterin-dependent oxidoreductase YjgC